MRREACAWPHLRWLGRRLQLLVLAATVAACSEPVPTPDVPDLSHGPAPVTAALGRAPGRCGETTVFSHVAVTTLRDLGFRELRDDPDYARRGRFWVTADRLEIPMPSGAPARPAQRLLCVEWADGSDMGMVEQSIPDDWAPPND